VDTPTVAPVAPTDIPPAIATLAPQTTLDRLRSNLTPQTPEQIAAVETYNAKTPAEKARQTRAENAAKSIVETPAPVVQSTMPTKTKDIADAKTDLSTKELKSIFTAETGLDLDIIKIKEAVLGQHRMNFPLKSDDLLKQKTAKEVKDAAKIYKEAYDGKLAVDSAFESAGYTVPNYWQLSELLGKDIPPGNKAFNAVAKMSPEEVASRVNTYIKNNPDMTFKVSELMDDTAKKPPPGVSQMLTGDGPFGTWDNPISHTEAVQHLAWNNLSKKPNNIVGQTADGTVTYKVHDINLKNGRQDSSYIEINPATGQEIYTVEVFKNNVGKSKSGRYAGNGKSTLVKDRTGYDYTFIDGELNKIVTPEGRVMINGDADWAKQPKITEPSVIDLINKIQE